MLFENKLKKLLSDGRLAFGQCSHIPSTAMVEIMGYAGFDFVMIDMEHGLYAVETSGELIRAAQGAGMTPLVRVYANDRGLILKALDMGAHGVVIPHVSGREDAGKAVEACRYNGPNGRGACPLVRANGYGLWNWEEYEEKANADIMVIMLIEDMLGVKNIEEIISVEGVAAIYLGPFDMSVSCGFKGNSAHSDIQKALDKVLSACRRHGIPVMHSLLNGRDVDSWAQKGVRLFVQSADSFIFARACKEFLESVAGLRLRKWENESEKEMKCT